MPNESVVIAILATLIAVMVVIGVARALGQLSARRYKIAAADHERYRQQAEVSSAICTALQAVATIFGEQTNLARAQIEEIGNVSKAQMKAIAEISTNLSASLDPEVQKKFSASVDHLSAILEKHGSDIEKLGDNTFMLRKAADRMNDNITAMRAIVYGGGRPEDFSSTVDDAETLRRANHENDIENLMRDHNFTRREAEARLRQMPTRSGVAG